jgi:glycosyltransferase involved in cell wall biosynthesis
MRIVIDYTSALTQGAGIGRYTRSLVEAVSRVDRANQYALFTAGRTPDRTPWPDNFELRSTRLSPRWLSVVWHRLGLPFAAEHLTGPCDLFHSPDFTLPPLRAARGVVTVHDLSFLRVPQYADPGLRAYLSAAVPRSIESAARVLADSQCTREDIVELLGVSREKVDVVCAGVDRHFCPIRHTAELERVRARYRLPERFILFVGTLEPRKNLVRLISAYARMRRKTGLPHELVIAGRPGWMYQAIYAQPDREAVGDTVHFPGFVEDADLPALYSLADLLAFPSLYEGFGLPPLEAMACGTPVVASNNSSLPEAVGSAALLVDAEDTDQLADAMARVLGNADLRANMVGLGFDQAARFTWEASAAQLLEAYRRAARPENG